MSCLELLGSCLVRTAPTSTPPKTEVRRVRSLRWAELRDSGPFHGDSKPRASHLKKGLAYEKRAGKVLQRMIRDGELSGDLYLQQWILFADAGGVQWARPDAYLVHGGGILLIECKLTQTDSATAQLLGLYLPLLRQIYNIPILCLQVCKNLRYVPSKLIEHPLELLEHPGPGVFTWQLR